MTNGSAKLPSCAPPLFVVNDSREKSRRRGVRPLVSAKNHLCSADSDESALLDPFLQPQLFC